MFTAIGAVLITLVHFPLFPAAPFLQYDPADVPILIAAFAFGPVAGILVTVLASFIQAFFLGGDGIYGFLMHVIATGILVTVASTLYRKFHTRTGAIIGLLLGTFAMGVGMMIANHFITPFYMGAPTEMVDAMLVTVILPFNLLKAGINSIVTFLVYKSVSKYIVHGEEFAKAPNKAAGDIRADTKRPAPPKEARGVPLFRDMNRDAIDLHALVGADEDVLDPVDHPVSTISLRSGLTLITTSGVHTSICFSTRLRGLRAISAPKASS